MSDVPARCAVANVPRHVGLKKRWRNGRHASRLWSTTRLWSAARFPPRGASPPQGYGPPPQQGYGPPPQQGYGPPPSYRPSPPPSASASPPPAASHPPPSNNRAAFQASCGPDAKLFCAGVPRENQGVVKCLSSHRAELSQTCQMYLQTARAERAAPPPSGAADMPPPPPGGAPPGNE